MTLPKRGLRKIAVNTNRFAWSVTGNDGGLHLSVIPLNRQDNLLTADFDYHSKVLATSVTATGVAIVHLEQQLVVTGRIVRRVILHAIQQGWNPHEKGAKMNMGKMDMILDES